MSDPTVANSDLTLLAPKFSAAVTAAVTECFSQHPPLEVRVFEGLRTGGRQAWLYAKGRTRLPGPTVTNAKTNLTSWHGYGLAVDIVHKTEFWTPFGNDSAKNEAWFANVGAVFKRHDCNWGGDWHKPDTPHMQWGRCTASPTQGAIDLIVSTGIKAVWDQLLASDSLQVVALASAAATPDAAAHVYGSLVPGGFFSNNPFDLSQRRSIRTNNPGALNKSPWQLTYPGFAGVTQPDSAGNVTSIYRTPEHGVGAWFHLICVRYGFGFGGVITLGQLAQRYSGVADPNSTVVRNYVVGWVAASGGQLTGANSVTLSDAAQTLVLARAMFRHEAGMNSPLHDNQIAFGVNAERLGNLPA